MTSCPSLGHFPRKPFFALVQDLCGFEEKLAPLGRRSSRQLLNAFAAGAGQLHRHRARRFSCTPPPVRRWPDYAARTSCRSLNRPIPINQVPEMFRHRLRPLFHSRCPILDVISSAPNLPAPPSEHTEWTSPGSHLIVILTKEGFVAAASRTRKPHSEVHTTYPAMRIPKRSNPFATWSTRFHSVVRELAIDHLGRSRIPMPGAPIHHS